MMVNFMCQFGQATVLRYLVKYSLDVYAKVFFFQVRLTFKSVDFE